MTTVYLDNNIFVSIQEKRFDSNFVSAIVTSPFSFFYSSAHIQEANRVIDEIGKIESEKPIKRFQILSLITKNNYLKIDPNSNEVINIIETPESVYATIHLIELGQSSFNSMVNWLVMIKE